MRINVKVDLNNLIEEKEIKNMMPISKQHKYTCLTCLQPHHVAMLFTLM